MLVISFSSIIIISCHFQCSPADTYNSIVNEDFFPKTVSHIHQTMNKLLHILNYEKSSKMKEVSSYYFIHRAISDHNHNLYEKIKLMSKPECDNKTISFIDLNELAKENISELEKTIERKEIMTKGIANENNKINNASLIETNHILNNSENSLEFIKDIILRVQSLSVEDFLDSGNTSKSDNTRRLLQDMPNDIEFWDPITETQAKIIDKVLNTRRIFRATLTKIRKYPFVVSIHVAQQFACAGSIIAKDLIITAASCIQLVYNNRFFREIPRVVSVRVGSSFPTIGGELIEVQEIYFHPGYVPKKLLNNLAILRLQTHLVLSKSRKKVKKIAFDDHAYKLPDISEGITILGWGAKSKTNYVFIDKLQISLLEFYMLEDCKEIYTKNFVTDKHFCAGFFSKGGGACNRDVGDPGLVNGVLIGVVSFGPPNCGTMNAPTVFTKVGFYAEWIRSIMELPTVVRPAFSMNPLTTLAHHPYKLPGDPRTATYTTTPRPSILPILKRSNLQGEFTDQVVLRDLLKQILRSDGLEDFLYSSGEPTELKNVIGPQKHSNFDSKVAKNSLIPKENLVKPGDHHTTAHLHLKSSIADPKILFNTEATSIDSIHKQHAKRYMRTSPLPKLRVNTEVSTKLSSIPPAVLRSNTDTTLYDSDYETDEGMSIEMISDQDERVPNIYLDTQTPFKTIEKTTNESPKLLLPKEFYANHAELDKKSSQGAHDNKNKLIESEVEISYEYLDDSEYELLEDEFGNIIQDNGFSTKPFNKERPKGPKYPKNYNVAHIVTRKGKKLSAGGKSTSTYYYNYVLNQHRTNPYLQN